MEAITRLVADSLARHGLNCSVDPRRLQWSRWFRCDSVHSLLVVPSKPGIFALAEEIMDLGPKQDQEGQDRQGQDLQGQDREGQDREGHDFSRAVTFAKNSPASAAELSQRRMLAVLQFSEDDDMAFTLDRMFTRINPMRARLSSGRCFLRFVVIDDQAQRRTICAALNQWLLTSAEKASGLPPDLASSMELASVARTCPERQPKGPSPASVDSFPTSAQAPHPVSQTKVVNTARNLDSGAAKNLHCPHPLPSGF